MRSTGWTLLAGVVALATVGPVANGVDHPLAASGNSGDDAVRRMVLVGAGTDDTSQERPFPGMVLELEGGTRFVGVIDRVATGRLSDRVYRGHLEGEPESWFILVSNQGVFAGEISSPAGHYHIRYAGNGGHVVRRIEPAQRLRCLSDAANPTGEPHPRQPRPANPPRAHGGGPLIDVMVVYTPSSRQVVGGTAAIEALIDSFIVYTNMAYERSGVGHRLRLVHAQEIDYVESGNSNTDLQRLRATDDGFMDDVHPIRDQWGADLVSLINTSGSAGVAFMMQVLSTAFAESAFSAIGAETDPIPGGLVFAHETAHNMGSSHNNFPGAPHGIFCYSFGFRTPDEQWRTIMSSSPGEFVDFFSSPDVMFQGQPLGVAGDGCPSDAAHNVRSLNEAAEVVAQFRPATVPCAPDSDCDGDVDLFDFAAFLNCVTGPNEIAPSDCLPFDFDTDSDVDQTDFAAFQVAFTGP